MFKKFLVSLALLALFLNVGIFAGNRATAQSDLLFGQQHYYTVMFRGNGEAIVLAKLTFTNSTEEQVSDFSFTIPKASVSELTVLQQRSSAGGCLRYDYYNPSICLEYGSSYNYNYPYYYNGAPGDYEKVKFTQSGNLYKLALPYSVEPNQSSTLVLAYAAKGYAKKTLGAFSFAFETLQVPSRVSLSQVAVDVDSELALKGKRSSVNYQTQTLAADFAGKGGLGAVSRNAELMNPIVGNIGIGGPIVKNAKNLAPNESLVVKGKYAPNSWLLKLPTILWLIVILAALIVGIWQLRRYWRKKHLAVPSSIKGGSVKLFESLFFSSLVTGFVSALILVVMSVLVRYLGDFLNDLVGYGNEALGIIVFIAFALLFLLVAVGPAIWLGMRKGWRATGYAIAMEIIWLVILGILYALLFAERAYPVYWY